MSTCEECGILQKRNIDEKWVCVKHNRIIAHEKLRIKTDCLFFIKKISEDGEVLSPLAHIALIEAERGSKKMRGPLG